MKMKWVGGKKKFDRVVDFCLDYATYNKLHETCTSKTCARKGVCSPQANWINDVEWPEDVATDKFWTHAPPCLAVAPVPLRVSIAEFCRIKTNHDIERILKQSGADLLHGSAKS